MTSSGDTPKREAREPARAIRGRRAEDFFVAGGPVAPDRPCYVTRPTDRELLERLAARDYCHVIAPRFSGKSSLVARAASRLRADGQLAAIIDVSQLGSRDGSTDVGRWYYGLAYRVLRDLRLNVDLQAWWQERMPLSPAQRLGEFFWEIVLGASRAPVTIFLDEIDSVEQLDYATELFGIVRGCHDARAGEPEYHRLSFVLLGAALPAGKARRAGLAAAEIGVGLELPDFRFDEARPLADGLGLPAGDAERALYRILYWTSGHPYLTQKLCQAVARSTVPVSSDAAVDKLVAARFFTRNAITRETSTSRVLDSLDRAHELARPALRLYKRIRRERRPKYEAGNPKHELLRVCGLVKVTDERRLVVRNRIYAEVFSHRWAREALPPEWGKFGRVAALVLLALGSVWAYVEVLPRPYEQTLRVASVELEEATEAWSAMRRIPGFAQRADRLLARVLTRQGRQAAAWPDMVLIDERMRALPGYEARADALLVDYWERRAALAEAAEERDEALLYRLRANVAGPTADAGRAIELSGGGYRQLQSVIRPAGVVEAVAPADGRSLVTLSAGNMVERWDRATGLPAGPAALPLLAEEFVTVRRRVSLEAEGQVAGLSVELRLDHPRPQDLQASLVAPSGRNASLPLGEIAEAGGVLLIDEAQAPGLRALRGEPTLGTWQLEITDRVGGEPGFLRGWSLSASPDPGHGAEDLPENPLLLPPPSLTSAVQAALAPRGSVVAALPRNVAASGRLHIWDVNASVSLGRFDVAAAERWVGFADERTLMLVERLAAGDALRVLEVDGSERFGYRAPGGFVTAPAVSPDGRYLAIAEADQRSASIRELESGREVFRLGGAAEVSALAVSSGALLLAVADRGDVVRVWHATDGMLLDELVPGAPVVALGFDPSGRYLASVDEAGERRVWDLAASRAELVLVRPGGARAPFGFDRSGRRVALPAAAGGYEVWTLPERAPGEPLLAQGSHAGRATAQGTKDRAPWQASLFTEQDELLTGHGSRSVRLWSLGDAVPGAELPPVAPVVALAASGLRVGTGLPDGRVLLRTRDPTSLELRQTIVTGGDARHGGPVTAMAFSPDGDRIASVGADGSVLLWDAGSGAQIGALFQHGSGEVHSIDLGPDGRRLLTAGALGARSWDAESGQPGAALGAGRAVNVVAFDPSGLRAFTGTPAGDVESWDVASGERLWSDAVDEPVTRLAISHDGRSIAVAGAAGLVRAWGFGADGRVSSVTLPTPVRNLQYSPDGAALLAQTDAWIHRFEPAEGRLVVTTSRLLSASMPPTAWRSGAADGSRIVFVGGPDSGKMMLFDLERAQRPPEEWQPDLAQWQQKLKLYFSAEGQLRTGIASPSAVPAAGPSSGDTP
ncbi:AAA-like domain-containing protein [Wenzhouxiangella sp. XN24]|uniref:AAA-like domain-containing protein n=1 Tax=Wenzhouxiangella sp. XN24 TaxID=2713569 RepID=UPI0013ED31CC|nr:AAA-like domain-containing protein [Wenzhouxiangella sp. XN24]NGX15720.1 hypothetical protein [Wenzhouxiangella sp. XN24]